MASLRLLEDVLRAWASDDCDPVQDCRTADQKVQLLRNVISYFEAAELMEPGHLHAFDILRAVDLALWGAQERLRGSRKAVQYVLTMPECAGVKLQSPCLPSPAFLEELQAAVDLLADLDASSSSDTRFCWLWLQGQVLRFVPELAGPV
jgi:hypothetical protein